jgi:hypothetical protein
LWGEGNKAEWEGSKQEKMQVKILNHKVLARQAINMSKVKSNRLLKMSDLK